MPDQVIGVISVPYLSPLGIYVFESCCARGVENELGAIVVLYPYLSS